MSAYIVSKAHIDALVDAALAGGLTREGVRWTGGGEAYGREIAEAYIYDPSSKWRGDIDRHAVGQMLCDANVASINARYPDTVDNPGDMPGPGDLGFLLAYRHRRDYPRDAAEILGAIRCFDYQACEYEGWEESDAKSFLDALTALCVEKLATGWEITEYQSQSEIVSLMDMVSGR